MFNKTYLIHVSTCGFHFCRAALTENVLTTHSFYRDVSLQTLSLQASLNICTHLSFVSFFQILAVICVTGLYEYIPYKRNNYKRQITKCEDKSDKSITKNIIYSSINMLQCEICV